MFLQAAQIFSLEILHLYSSHDLASHDLAFSSSSFPSFPSVKSVSEFVSIRAIRVPRFFRIRVFSLSVSFPYPCLFPIRVFSLSVSISVHPWLNSLVAAPLPCVLLRLSISSFQPHHQNSYIRWRNSRNSGRLTQGRWPNLRQLL